MQILRKIFFIPIAFFAKMLTYTIVQIIAKIKQFLGSGFDIESITGQPSMLADIIGQSLSAIVFFIVGFHIVQSNSKKTLLALIIGFLILGVLLDTNAIVKSSQHYRFIGLVVSLIASYVFIKKEYMYPEE